MSTIAFTCGFYCTSSCGPFDLLLVFLFPFHEVITSWGCSLVVFHGMRELDDTVWGTQLDCVHANALLMLTRDLKPRYYLFKKLQVNPIGLSSLTGGFSSSSFKSGRLWKIITINLISFQSYIYFSLRPLTSFGCNFNTSASTVGQK